jgi:hypothetical protein
VWLRRRQRQSYDEVLTGALAERMKRMLDAGESMETATKWMQDELQQELTDASPRVIAAELVRNAPKIIRNRRRNHRRVQQRIRVHWGEALDLFMLVVVIAEAAGTRFDQEHRPPDGEWFDPVYDALLGLHARACRTALEVYHLLSDGLPKGALARSRTLHEIAVTAIIISDYGRRPDHVDLAERFLDHDAVATYKDAVRYQQDSETLNDEPLADDVIAEMKAAFDAAVERYGKAYKEPYGWAAGLKGPSAPDFSRLEELANLSHLRSHYKWMSHEVHSDARGLTFNVGEWGETLYRETSYSNEGLNDPGDLALISLQQSTVSLLLSPEDDTPFQSMAEAGAMSVLVDKAGDAFVAAQNAVEAHNAQQQRRQARRRPVALWQRLTKR